MAEQPGDDFTQQLLFVLKTHNSIRKAAGFGPQTDEGHFVNENTIIRLAVMMAARQPTLKPRGLPKNFSEWRKDERDAHISDVFEKATHAQRSVRTLFLFRNLIVHEGGLFDPTKTNPLERRCYKWFCCEYQVPLVSDGCKLVLAGEEVIRPLVEGCVDYHRERLGARGR